jgi:hypothetical protein
MGRLTSHADGPFQEDLFDSPADEQIIYMIREVRILQTLRFNLRFSNASSVSIQERSSLFHRRTLNLPYPWLLPRRFFSCWIH